MDVTGENVSHLLEAAAHSLAEMVLVITAVSILLVSFPSLSTSSRIYTWPEIMSFATTNDVDCRTNASSVRPQGAHIAYAKDGVALSFFTCAEGGTPTVNVEGTSFQGSTTKRIRYHHDVLLKNLKRGVTFEYTAYLSESPEDIFEGTLRIPSERSSPSNFTAAILGDMGVNNSDGTLRILSDRMDGYDFVAHVGDVGYADDYRLPFHIEPSSGVGYEDVYDYFQRLISPIATRIPWMVSPGNHDVTCHVTDDLGCPEEERNFSQFNARFRMPSVESNATTDDRRHNMWYSYRVGSVHFVSISTESDFPHSPTTPHTFVGGGAGGGFGNQLGWLESDLQRASVDPEVSHIIVMGHRPFYASKATDWPLRAPIHIQRAFEPLFRTYGVDLYLTAHKHYYERCVPAFEGKADPNGTIQVINGAAGNNEGVDKGKGNGGLIVASNYASQGFCELSVESTNGDISSVVLRLRYVLSTDGSVFDEVALPSRRAWS